MGVYTFGPRDPCSPAGPSGPRGPWNRKKGLAQWTPGVSLGLGTRRVGLTRAVGLSLHKPGAPSSSLPTDAHPEGGLPCAVCLLRRLCRGLTWLDSARGPNIPEWGWWCI